MNDNIISPTITNGITITVMAVIGFAVLFLIAQGAMHLLGMTGASSQ